ncbi:MAG TPA: hypothetical protein PKW76_14595 [bacterium]|nr:hypothetical protein [bacterium]HPG46902.1 hypothetical protein [bacterium]
MRSISILIICASFLLNCGYTSLTPLPPPPPQEYNVEIDGLASVDAKDYKTYILLPGNEGITWGDLQFQEYANYVMRVLSVHGYQPAEKAEDADVAIILSYGIGEPQTKHFTYTLPQWGQTGVYSSSTSGTATNYGNWTTFRTKTTSIPSYGITGYTSHVGSVTTYFRYVYLTAYNFIIFKESSKQIQLWQTTITSQGKSGYLREVFPILISAAAPYLGKDTGKRIEIEISDSDEVVKAVKGIPR